jgi:hypothetical protein
MRRCMYQCSVAQSGIPNLQLVPKLPEDVPEEVKMCPKVCLKDVPEDVPEDVNMCLNSVCLKILEPSPESTATYLVHPGLDCSVRTYKRF